MSDLIRIAEATTLKSLADARSGGDEADEGEGKSAKKVEVKEIPEFRPGDTVVVHVRVREGGKERIQVFKGDVIQRRGSGLRSTVTVRKVSNGVGVDQVQQTQAARQGRVRRAKLFYLRGRSGKAARIRERRMK